MAELGARLERYRLERNLTQRELAEEAGVEYKTVLRMEAGETAKVSSLIRVLRALGLLGSLDRLVPEPAPSPMELLELRGRTRRRASGKRRRTLPRRDPGSPWRWGDEAPESEASEGGSPGRGSSERKSSKRGSSESEPSESEPLKAGPER